jgi:hypothetical protein
MTLEELRGSEIDLERREAAKTRKMMSLQERE